jgi:hypothetical protein
LQFCSAIARFLTDWCVLGRAGNESGDGTVSALESPSLLRAGVAAVAARGALFKVLPGGLASRLRRPTLVTPVLQPGSVLPHVRYLS